LRDAATVADVRPLRALVLASVLVVVLGACSDDESSSPTTSAATAPATTSVPSTSAPTTAAPTTVTAPPSSTAAPSTTIAYDPGEACTLGTNPDCIDPNEAGEGIYLIGGADCMSAARQNDSSTAICTDLDRDGRAGYPDRG
jgi:hypothetical protein